jgi:ectoine hydroxylase-related dioxygenase (phytanoyl-CoA dioxygenase family)
LSDLVRPISEEEVVAYERDGVVCLRGVMPGAWLARMEEPVEVAIGHRASVDMTRMARSIESTGGAALADERARRLVEARGAARGRFYGGTDHWRHQPEFRAFAAESPLPEIAAALMRAGKVNLYEDSVLVKEPGTVEPTAFHQDLAYFHVEGDQVCTAWCPLDAVRRDTGAVGFVRGSHRWARTFRPNLFVSTQPIPGTRGEEVPDIHDRSEDFDVVYFDLEPGDVTVHHARTLHGAGANRSTSRRRRAISVRYCGDDARYFLRKGAPLKPHHHGVRDGDILDGEDCPIVWRA